MSDSIIEDSIFRFFAKALDKDTCIQAEQTGHVPEQWQMAVDTGFSNLLSPEDHGGAGIAWADAFALFWGIGYYRVPLPLADTVIVNYILNTAGFDAGTTQPLAVVDEVAAAKLVLRHSADGVALSGSAAYVPWARSAEKVLV